MYTQLMSQLRFADKVDKYLNDEFYAHGFLMSCYNYSLLLAEACHNKKISYKIVRGYANYTYPDIPDMPDTSFEHFWVEIAGKKYDSHNSVCRIALELGTSPIFISLTLTVPDGFINGDQRMRDEGYISGSVYDKSAYKSIKGIKQYLKETELNSPKLQFKKFRKKLRKIKY